MKVKENDFVKVIKGQYKGKRGTVIADNNTSVTLRKYPFPGYIHVKHTEIHHCDLTGKLIK